MTEYDLRNDILEALNLTYAPEYKKGGDWYAAKFFVGNPKNKGTFAVDTNLQLTTDILATYAYSHIDPENDKRAKYYGESMYRRIVDIVWACYPGGTTAEGCAKRICKILNVEVDEK